MTEGDSDRLIGVTGSKIVRRSCEEHAQRRLVAPHGQNTLMGTGSPRRIRRPHESSDARRQTHPEARDRACAVPRTLDNRGCEHRWRSVELSEAPSLRRRGYRRPTGFLNLISLFPSPCASYQCRSALQIVPSAKRTVATPFIFRHFAMPYSRFNLLRSRTPRPDAIVSIAQITPMILNRTAKAYRHLSASNEHRARMPALCLTRPSPSGARIHGMGLR